MPPSSLSAVSHGASTAASTLCAVCTAKRTGARVPKRKCTCNSGDIATRNRLPLDRFHERCARDAFEIMFGSFVQPRYDINGDTVYTIPREYALSARGLVRNTYLAADGVTVYHGIEEVCMAGDMHVLETICKGLLGLSPGRYTSCLYWREAISAACESGKLEVLQYLLRVSSVSVAELCPYDEPVDVDRFPDDEPVPNPAPPLWIASRFGHSALVSALIDLRADVNQTAYDGSSPFWIACSVADLAMMRLLVTFGADMEMADQDGAAPLHIAAACGEVEVVQFLQLQGVSMETKGTVYEEQYQSAVVNSTALTIARYWGQTEVVQLLRSFAPISSTAQKRQYSELPIDERALCVGVAAHLKPIPPELDNMIKHGSAEECEAARKEKQKLQRYNQKLVSRAETVKMKQTQLTLGTNSS